MSRRTVTEAALVLADGEVFEGEAIGAEPDGGVAAGEVVFNTVLAGYQEVVTDPSYAGQIITFTFPQNAFGQREHGQPLRKLKWIRRETGAKFIIDLKKVDADGNLTCEWTGINDQCIQARKLMVAAVRKYNAWKRHQPQTQRRHM